MKEHGISTYDFCGTPPLPNSRIRNTLTTVWACTKTSFTKNVTDFVGVYDQFHFRAQI